MARRGRPPKPVPPLQRREPRGASATIAVEAVLEAAERVLAEHDVAGLTTNRVAEVAGVSVGTLYRYFPNKESLVRALHERYLAAYVSAVQQTVVASAGEPLAILALRIADAVGDVFEAQAPVHRALRQMRSAADLQSRIDAELERVCELSAFALHALDPTTDLAEARALAFVIVHACDGLANALAIHADRIDARLAARTLAEMVAGHFERRRARRG